MNTILIRILIVIAAFSCSSHAVTPGRDFIVNRNNQNEMSLPIVKSDARGNTWLFWCALEKVNGSLSYYILYRKFDMNGIALGAPVPVEGLYKRPHVMKVAMADSGNFVVCYSIGQNQWALYMKRYDKTGARIDLSSVLLIDDVSWNNFDCTINNKGDCAVVARKAQGLIQMFGWIYPAGGTPIALPDGQLWDSYPLISLNDSRRFVYLIGTESDGLWYRTGTFSSSALTWADAGAFVTTSYLKKSHTTKVAMFASGEFLVLWQTEGKSAGEANLNGRRFAQNGTPSGGTFAVASGFPYDDSYVYTGLSIAPTGQFLASWRHLVGHSMRTYSKTGTAVTSTISLFPSALAEGVYQSDLEFSEAIDSLGEATSASNPGGEVYFQRYTATGGINGMEMKANVGSGCTNPAAAVNRSLSTSAVVFENAGDGRILVQIFNSKKIYKKPAPLTVNASASTGSNPAISLANGKMAVVWQDVRGGETAPAIYLQQYDPGDESFSPAGGNRPLSEVGTFNYFPSVASGTGKHLVVWQSSPTATTASGQVYGQFMNTTGSASGGNFHISAATTNGIRPVAVSNGKNDFAVVWQQTNAATRISTLFARRYTVAGAAVGDTIRINGPGSATAPSAAMDTAGNLGVAWVNGGDEVHCRVIATNGSSKVAEFRVDTGSAIKSNPGLAMNSKGAMIVTWKTTVAKAATVASRLYNADGTQQTGVRHNSDAPHRISLPLPAVAAGDSFSLRVWVNSFCLDTTKTDICGEFAALNDYSTTAIRKPGVLARTTGVFKGTRGVQYFDCRGRLLGTVPGTTRTNGIVIARTSDGSIGRVMRIED